VLSTHLSSSFVDVLGRFSALVEKLPRWLRPAFYGAGLIFVFMLWRGGLVAIPILFAWLLFTHPATLFHQLLPLIFVYVPGAGFLVVSSTA
jgi:hypothetical protein